MFVPVRGPRQPDSSGSQGFPLSYLISLMNSEKLCVAEGLELIDSKARRNTETLCRCSVGISVMPMFDMSGFLVADGVVEIHR
ncbi:MULTISPECIES: hypothetical protein [unclassified Bradyrhizobium]|uniref:hypothetical protein n=1 Tax=Bradyrhizobium TaxID=374 RepID=UPI0028EF6D00|nr:MULTISPECIES: hypothetical protein [unclassified Bradyrhizobium]